MPLRDLRKLWSSSKQRATSENVDVDASSSCLQENSGEGGGRAVQQCSLPLLQVWPSQESPKIDEDRDDPSTSRQQRFVFNCEDHSISSQQNDSGIDSVQASPSPRPSQCFQAATTPLDELSPTLSVKSRRASASVFLHPNHARLIRPRSSFEPQSTVANNTTEDDNNNSGAESSTNSSMTSIAAAAASSRDNFNSRHSDPWDSRRRSTVTSARYSMLDALDLEYALIRAATRSSVGRQSSFSNSFSKLTFTQTLAFPALARGLANRRRRSVYRRRVSSSSSDRDDRSLDSGTNALVKALAVIALVFTSLLVFGIVFNYVTV